MSVPTRYTFIAADTAYVCASQTLGAAGSLTINGTGADGMFTPSRVRLTVGSPGFERTISLTSAANLSAINFTVTGTDIRGAAITQTIAGPNVNTVYTTSFFYSVTSVTANAAVGSAVTVGIGTTGRSQWYRMNYQVTPVSIGLGITVTNTDLTWTVVQTTYNVELAEPAANSIINNSDTNLVAQTTSRQGNYVVPFGAFRCNIASSTAGSLVFDIYQAGIV